MNYKEVLKKSGCSVACTHFLGNCSTSHPPADSACDTGCSCKTALHDLAGGGLCACDMVLVLPYCRRFLLGLILGCLLAYLAAKHPVVETLLWPWMATIKSVPVASFVVICLIWLSARNLSVFISFLIVIPIIYQNVLEGLRAENREMQEVATVFQLPWRKRFRYIELPKLRPFLLSACRVTTGMAWKAGIAAEIIGVPNGSIGKMLYTAKIYLDTDDLLAWTVIIVVISVVAEKVFLAGLSRLLNPCSRFMEDTDAGY